MAYTTSCVSTKSGSSSSVAGYGGTVDPKPVPAPVPPVKNCSNQGIGNGPEGSDPGKSSPHGGSNDEDGRTPGTSLGKCGSSKEGSAPKVPVDVVPVTSSSPSVAGYGGTVDPTPIPVPVPPVKNCSNQGIGNGPEGSDPGKSSPHGGSNDEDGRTPGTSLGKCGSSKEGSALKVPVDVVPVSNSSPSVAGYGGTVDPTPVPTPEPTKCHYNQGIGNGAEGGDPGKSRPHGGSNDEGGRTPGTPMGKDPLTGTQGCDALVCSKGSDSWSCKDDKSSKDPIVPNVVVLGKSPCGESKEINQNLWNLGCGSSSKSPDTKGCKFDNNITFGNTPNPLQGSSSCSSNFALHR